MNKEQISQLAFDCVLPSSIFFNENLEPNCIKLYAMVRNLAKMHGYCYATNDYLSSLLNCDGRSIQNWLSSLKKEGYLEIETDKNGIYWQRRLYLSDEFKKCLRKENSFTPPCSDFHPPMKKDSPIKEEYIKEEYKKEYLSCPDSEAEPRTAKKNLLSEECFEIANELWKRIVHVHPKAKLPNLESWAHEVDKAMRIDRRTRGELLDVIQFAFEQDPFWARVLQSAEKLRKNFDKIWLKMRPAGTSSSKNRLTVREAQSQLKAAGSQKAKEIYLTEHEVVRLDTGKRLLLNLDSKEFESEFLKIFEIRKYDE